MCCNNILIFNYFVRLTVHMNWNICIGRKNVRLNILSGNQWRWNSFSRKEKHRYENQIFCWFHLKLKLTDKAISCMLPKKIHIQTFRCHLKFRQKFYIDMIFVSICSMKPVQALPMSAFTLKCSNIWLRFQSIKWRETQKKTWSC